MGLTFVGFLCYDVVCFGPSWCHGLTFFGLLNSRSFGGEGLAVSLILSDGFLMRKSNEVLVCMVPGLS